MEDDLRNCFGAATLVLHKVPFTGGTLCGQFFACISGCGVHAYISAVIGHSCVVPLYECACKISPILYFLSKQLAFISEI